jgi:hypothetical protein
VSVDAHSPARNPLRRLALLAALAGVGLVAVPAIAQADDLIQLNGDLPVTLQGGVSYGLLYLDGNVRLAGDTSIFAGDVFIGPDAQLQTCFAGGNGNDCGNGRSLSITATGGVAISPAIDLRGGVGTSRSGGTLVIHAARVALGGGVETAGTNAQSGGIVIDSPGLVVTQNLHAPGAGISVHGGGGVSIGGDVSSAGTDTATGGDPARVTSGGGIDIGSGSGDVSVLGSVSSFGKDMAGAGALEGGHGGVVSVAGGEIHISGAIDSSAGRGVDISAGQPGGIALAARGSIVVSGPVNASGDISTNGFGSNGAVVNLSAKAGLAVGSVSAAGGASTSAGAGVGGSVTLSSGAALSAGAINTSGAGSPMGGTHGGAVTVTGASVALGAVTSDAGDASSDAAGGNGDTGGAVTIAATGNAGVGAVSARGGSGRTTGAGGSGGVVAISGDRVTTGSVTTLGENLSASGASVTLAAQSSLFVGGAVDTSGAAGANGNPARVGGYGGAMLLSVAHGPITLGGRLRSEGGAGGNGAAGGGGAAGGSGGSIEIVVGSVASSTGVLSGGGNGGTAGAQNAARGAGGNGGRVRIWAQLPSLILLQLVDSTGGTGDPNGVDGPQVEEAAPTGLSISKTRTLSFTTHAPDAEGYRVFASIGGAPAKVAMTTKASSVPLPKVAACVGVAFTVAGFASGVGWQSDPIGPANFMAPPSDDQSCTDAPQVTLGVQKLKKKLRALSKKKWRVPVRFLADGMGLAHVVISRGKKVITTADKPLAAGRRNVSVTLTLPKAVRKSGKFLVTVSGSAPLGKARSKSTLVLEVKR